MASEMDVDQDRNSRSPSPAQPPPTPAAPGPRASALQKLYNDAINHVVKTISYSNFSSCFPTPSNAVPGSIKILHEQFTEKLGESMRKEFEAILAERNVVPSLNELDRLIEDAKRRKARALEENNGQAPVPPHTLPAKQLYISHLAPTLGEYDKQMKERHDMLATENQEIMNRIMQQRNDIKSLIDGLDNVVKDLNGSVEALQPQEIEALRDENREVDEAMR